MIRLRDCGILAVGVTVPKATINKNNGFVFRKNDVRLTRQIFAVKSVTETLSKQELSHHNLRLGVFAFNVRHTAFPLFFW